MTYRFRVTITIGPTDSPIMDVFRWVIGIVADAHARAPFPVGVRVEPILDRDED
jgi:hypothetical protein